MSWKECSVMDERLQFVARRLAGESMAELCREFGISRKTGYKIFDRYQQCGVQGLTDRSRRPFRYANKLPFQVENYILNVKHEHSSWGARKIRERLIRRFSGIPIPAKSTIHAVLDRHGLVERRGRVRCHAQGTPLSLGQRPNELWCTDYKGEFLLGNRQYSQPRKPGGSPQPRPTPKPTTPARRKESECMRSKRRVTWNRWLICRPLNTSSQRVRDEVLKDLFERGRIENPRHLAELLSVPLENPSRLDKVMVAAHYEALLPDAGGLRISMGDTDVMRRWLEAQTQRRKRSTRSSARRGGSVPSEARKRV